MMKSVERSIGTSSRFVYLVSIAIFFLNAVVFPVHADQPISEEINLQKIAATLALLDTFCDSEKNHPETLSAQLKRSEINNFSDEQLALIPHILKAYFHDYPAKDVLNCFSVAEVHEVMLPWQAIEIADYMQLANNNPELLIKIMKMSYGSLEKNTFVYFLSRRIIEKINSGELDLALLRDFVFANSGTKIEEIDDFDLLMSKIIEAFLHYIEAFNQDNSGNDDYIGLFHQLGLFSVWEMSVRSRYFSGLGFIPENSIAPSQSIYREVALAEPTIITEDDSYTRYYPVIRSILSLFELNNVTSISEVRLLKGRGPYYARFQVGDDGKNRMQVYIENVAEDSNEFVLSIIHELIHAITDGSRQDPSSKSKTEEIFGKIIDKIQIMPNQTLVALGGDYGATPVVVENRIMAMNFAISYWNDGSIEISEENRVVLNDFIPKNRKISVFEADLLIKMLNTMNIDYTSTEGYWSIRNYYVEFIAELVGRLVAGSHREAVLLSLDDFDKYAFEKYPAEEETLSQLVEELLRSGINPNSNLTLGSLSRVADEISSQLDTIIDEVPNEHFGSDDNQFLQLYSAVKAMDVDMGNITEQLEAIVSTIRATTEQKRELRKYLLLYINYHHALVKSDGQCMIGDELAFAIYCTSDLAPDSYLEIALSAIFHMQLQEIVDNDFDIKTIQKFNTILQNQIWKISTLKPYSQQYSWVDSDGNRVYNSQPQ
ncbi:MAG: hypothetical protein COY80_05315 [Candidatus Pacebacteria bacterium CG_4_10_14_0_8_um_filter_42_14]|nr:MAG: hypothetical protein COY80_05315 [Candidatus Pacebacteria bacterium CG_4_10_14_0_8_um_filter_42_14]